jgi:glycosyltransferase involved in cell wall biosynthesis
LKILYFTRDYTTHDRRFLNALAETEHQVYFLRLERRGHSLEERPLPAKIHNIAWTGGREPYKTRRLLHLLRGLKKVLADIQPDVVQAGPIQTCALLAAAAGTHPLVSTSWGSDLLVDAESSPWMRWLTRTTLSRSDVLVGDCEAVRQKAIQFGMPAERIVTFPWGIDLDHFSPPFGRCVSEGHALSAFSILSTRSWEPIYGVDVLAQAFALAVQKLAAAGEPEKAARLRLVMLGNGSQAGNLRSIFEKAGVSAQVSFPGQVSHDDLPRNFHEANLYVSASQSDGSSISLLEAMACETPVLVSDIPGNREWVTDNENGWLFEVGNAQALASLILKSLERPEKLEQMKDKGRRVVEARADWKVNFGKLLEAYDMAAAHHGRSPHAAAEPALSKAKEPALSKAKEPALSKAKEPALSKAKGRGR